MLTHPIEVACYMINVLYSFERGSELEYKYTLITHAIFLRGPTANGVWVSMFERRKDYTICLFDVSAIDFDIMERTLSLNGRSAVFPIAHD